MYDITVMKQKFTSEDRYVCNCHDRASSLKCCGYCSSSHHSSINKNISFKNRAKREQQTGRETPI